MARLTEAAGIPPGYEHCELSKFNVGSNTPSELLQALRAAQQYVDTFEQVDLEDTPFVRRSPYREMGLLFMGPPGIGKTHLAVGVLKELIRRHRIHGRFVVFTPLVHQIQSTFDPSSPESKHEILDPLLEAHVLVLDELGAQQPTPWVRDVLYLIINHRYTHRLPTIFTSNYLLEMPSKSADHRTQNLDRGRDVEPRKEDVQLLANRLPAMLVSRLYEMTQPVLMTTVQDFRRNVKAHAAGKR